MRIDLPRRDCFRVFKIAWIRLQLARQTAAPPFMETRFKVLRVFANLQTLIGALFFLAGIVTTIIVIGGINGMSNDKLAAFIVGTYGIAGIVSLFLSGLFFMSFGQFLQVVMQIEENTRKP